MSPIRIEEYILNAFNNTNINVQVISDPKILKAEYPLFAAVDRGSAHIPRFAGRIIFLTYEPKDPTCVLETVMLVGKGVTYDTGGADIKINHNMVGMCRDKCGAAASVGFMQV
jgi:leucyl aminopeptidase